MLISSKRQRWHKLCDLLHTPDTMSDIPAIAKMEAASAAFEAQYYSETATMEEMFGQSEGAVRQKHIFDTYHVGTMAIPWFTADGKRSIERHPVNQRKNDAVKASYVNSIAEKGLCEGVRGEPWMVAPVGWEPRGVVTFGVGGAGVVGVGGAGVVGVGGAGVGAGATFMAITFATLSAAVYDAAELPSASSNKFIQRALADGLGGCKILHSRTPLRVLVWLRDFHNSFHSGCSSSFIEELQVALDAEVQWTEWRTSANISARSGGYNTQYAKFVSKNFSSVFKSQSHFLRAKALANEVESGLGTDTATAAFKKLQLLSNHTDYLCQDMPSSHETIDILHYIHSTVGRTIKHWHSKDVASVLVSAIAWAAVPKVPSSIAPELSLIPHLFKDVGDVKRLLRLLSVEMLSSKVYSPKRSEKVLAGMNNVERFSSEHPGLCVAAGMRKTVFVDDLLQMGTHITENWYMPLSQDIKDGLVEFQVAKCILFIMTGKCVADNKTYTTWSTLRPVIQRLSFEWIKAKVGAQTELSDKSISHSILSSLSSSASLPSVEEIYDDVDPSELHKRFQEEFVADAAGQHALTMVKELLDMYPTDQALFLGAEYRSCIASLQTYRERTLPVADIVKHICEVMFVNPAYVSQTKDVLFVVRSGAAEFGDPDNYLDQVYSSPSQLDFMGKMRTILTSRILEDMLTSLCITAEPKINVQEMGRLLNSNVDLIAAQDICKSGWSDSWCKFWTAVLQCIATTHSLKSLDCFTKDDDDDGGAEEYEPSAKRIKEEGVEDTNMDDSVVDAQLSVQMSIAELNSGGGKNGDCISTLGLDIVRASIQRIAWECVTMAATEGDTDVFNNITIDVREKNDLATDFRAGCKFSFAIWRHHLVDTGKNEFLDWEVQGPLYIPQWG